MTPASSIKAIRKEPATILVRNSALKKPSTLTQSSTEKDELKISGQTISPLANTAVLISQEVYITATNDPTSEIQQAMGTNANTVTRGTLTMSAMAARNADPWKDTTISINQSMRKTSGSPIN
jgi:hypothetical protein